MLHLNQIMVRLGGKPILDNATAALPEGSRVGLIGRNGAGKTTLVRVVTGLIEADGGSVDMPRGSRIGYIAQEAPSGTASPFETVLAADQERRQLLEAEEAADPERLAEIHERLNAIGAHSAPARASRILAGLGFDEELQHRPLDSFSGGWRMRVALAALLFSAPDLLVLDEPSNHLDLEALLWLEDFLKSYRRTLLIVSHERDFLNEVVDHILHLERGQLTLYPGGYDAFERQRAERQAQLASARERQLAQREKLQAFVDRWRAKASKARQAQSRVKALARLQPVAELVDDPSLSFDFPSPRALRPPLITLDNVAVGYGDTPVLKRLDLRLDPDDRVAFLGRNGNGKTTLARLLAGQLQPMEGEVNGGTHLRVGYFTQYQVEELESGATPYQHMARLMPNATPAAVRSQLGRFGFSGEKALLPTGQMSGGERARLALALITRDAPHLLILDEPTNHLDVDAREALVQALNAFEGAVVIVSHDRHMLNLVADRLLLVADGTLTPFDGTIEDYSRLVLSRDSSGPADRGDAKASRKEERRNAALAREKSKSLRSEIRNAEAEVARLQQAMSEIDRAMFEPGSVPGLAKYSMSVLMVKRAEVERKLEAAEVRWVEASERLESVAA